MKNLKIFLCIISFLLILQVPIQRPVSSRVFIQEWDYYKLIVEWDNPPPNALSYECKLAITNGTVSYDRSLENYYYDDFGNIIFGSVFNMSGDWSLINDHSRTRCKVHYQDSTIVDEYYFEDTHSVTTTPTLVPSSTPTWYWQSPTIEVYPPPATDTPEVYPPPITDTPFASLTPTITPTYTETPTQTDTLESTSTPTPTLSSTYTPTLTPTPISTFTPTSTPTVTVTPTITPTPNPITKRNIRLVNMPFISGTDTWDSMAIFWYGKVDSNNNYTDVRVKYNETELTIRVQVFDRLLWYDIRPSKDTITQWDSVSLYINPGNNLGAYRFDAQLNWWEQPRDQWEASLKQNGSNWELQDIPFTTESDWRGDSPNNNVDDRGYGITFHIPYTSLGIGNQPPEGTRFDFGVVTHDKDSIDSGVVDTHWPESFTPNNLLSWGRLNFGIPTYTPKPYTNPQTIILRKDYGTIIMDGMIGGGTMCGDSPDLWKLWGNTNYKGSTYINIQNQGDVADWPCYSKYYLTFDIRSIPKDKVIVSAQLVLHLFGSAGFVGTDPQPSYIQILRLNQVWNEKTLTWNNAPIPVTNYGGTWVNPMSIPLVWPGVPYSWDVTKALVDSHVNNYLWLALYDSDWNYHSGKYFSSNSVGDWNSEARPELIVTFGDKQ